MNVTTVDSLRDYCLSQLPDIPYSNVSIESEIYYGEDETITAYHCHVESKRGVFLGTSTSLAGTVCIM